MTVNFSIANNLGFNFTQTYLPPYDQTAAISTTNSPDNPALPCAIGTHALGTNNTEYVFGLAAAAIATNQWVVVTPVTFSIAVGTKLLATQQAGQFGIAQTAIASGSYGWIAIRGAALTVLAKLGTLANVRVYASSSNGRVVGSTSFNSGVLTGITLTQSTTSARLTGTTCHATWPRLLV